MDSGDSPARTQWRPVPARGKNYPRSKPGTGCPRGALPFPQRHPEDGRGELLQQSKFALAGAYPTPITTHGSVAVARDRQRSGSRMTGNSSKAPFPDPLPSSASPSSLIIGTIRFRAARRRGSRPSTLRSTMVPRSAALSQRGQARIGPVHAAQVTVEKTPRALIFFQPGHQILQCFRRRI